MEKELRSPPSSPVLWTVTRRDGVVGKATAQTAWKAAALLHWSFMDCIQFEEGAWNDQQHESNP